MKDKSETSTTDLIILFFLLFIISNILFAVACMLLSDDAESNLKLIKDFAISTGSLVGINIVGLILIECFERIEKYIFPCPFINLSFQTFLKLIFVPVNPTSKYSLMKKPILSNRE